MGIEDATHVRFAPTVVNGDVDGTRQAAEVELTDAALEFAGKLSAVGTLQLVND